MNRPKSKKILVFDFDGTIADTFNKIVDIANELSNEYKYNRIKDSELKKLKNKTLRQTLDHLQVPILKVPRILMKARSKLNKDILNIKPIGGLKDMLIELDQLGFKMGILSSNSSKNIRHFLKNHDLDLFEFIRTSSKIWGKNRALKRMMRRMNIQMEDIIYIGDEVRDIVAAKKVGIRCAAVTWGFNSSQALKAQNPDFLLKHPKELIQLLA